MNGVSPEQQQLIDDLRATVRSALGEVEPGSDGTATWQVLVEQVGVAGVLVPEAHGGLGLGAGEVVAVAEEIGGSAARVPFLSHAVAAPALLRSAPAGPTVDALLADAASGARRIAVAHPRPGAVVADDGRLTGVVATAVDAPGADVLLVATPVAGEDAVHLVEAGTDGLDVTERSTLDLSRSIGGITLAAVPATPLLAGTAARDALAAARRWSHLALAADQVGLARRALAITVEYVGLRTQFGAVIGSFQAVKHRCTDVLLEIELAAALVSQAATALDAGADPQDLVATAALQADSAAFAATDAAIQLHGGIGFTWEHAAHHYFRRARTNASLLGPAQELRDAVAASVGLGDHRA